MCGVVMSSFITNYNNNTIIVGVSAIFIFKTNGIKLFGSHGLVNGGGGLV
jgi:hypothetical protein